MRPERDQIEVCVFGPGYGECTILHLGDDNWIVVDSCKNSVTKRPVSIEYFESIGVPLDHVRLVVATHWHDDHVRGLAEQLNAFSKAKFCCSGALTNKEFLATVVAYDQGHNIRGGSGVSEVLNVMEILAARSSPMRASPNRPVLTLEASNDLPKRVVCTLSPSDRQFDRFLAQLATFLPVPLETKTRMPDQAPNHLSVVIHVTIGDQAILLGADLEERGVSDLGWSAIVCDCNRPRNFAQIFKIPHHGSQNGHCDAVWTDMLVPNPVSILTPWNRSNGLPTQSDVERIVDHTHSGFCTSSLSRRPRTRAYHVEKQIRETVRRIRPVQFETGWVRLRNGGSVNPSMWCIETSDEACALSEWRAV